MLLAMSAKVHPSESFASTSGFILFCGSITIPYLLVIGTYVLVSAG